jgi:hypothetical protein
MLDTLQVVPDTLAVVAHHGHHIHWASNCARVAGLALWSYYVAFSVRKH